jgi:hypothetical protein
MAGPIDTGFIGVITNTRGKLRRTGIVLIGQTFAIGTMGTIITRTIWRIKRAWRRFWGTPWRTGKKK